LPSAKIKNKLAKFIKIYAYQTKWWPTLSSNLAKPAGAMSLSWRTASLKKVLGHKNDFL